MVAHIEDVLIELARRCQVELGDCRSGWSTDVWELSEEDVLLVKEIYRQLLLPPIEDEVVQALYDDGLPVEAMFYEIDEDTEEAVRPELSVKNTIARADMVELVAAASMVQMDGAPLETILMPNVPKTSRRLSERGIDVLSIYLDPSDGSNAINAGDRIFIGSVKHSINSRDLGDLRRKLVNSVSEDSLNRSYLLGQLRLLHGRLQERGIHADKVFLFLKGSPMLDPRHFRIVAVAGVDTEVGDAFSQQLESLTDSEPGLRTIRQVRVPGLVKLHEFER